MGVVVHGLCYTVEFSVVFLTFILGFDFLIQFYEGHLLVEARHNRCNNRILLNLLSFIPSSFTLTPLHTLSMVSSNDAHVPRVDG